MYGKDSIHLYAQTFICWIIIKFFPAGWQHLFVFPLAMTYLSVINIIRMKYDYGGIVVNVTGSMMILTQRMILLSFSVYDGHARKIHELNETEKRQRVVNTPNLLEMVSYTFFFPAITSGPLFFYKDYEHFILYGPPEKKSCLLPVMRKLFNGGIAMATSIIGNQKFKPKSIADKVFIMNTNMDQKMIGCVTGLILTKSKFYFAWSISDATCNVAGFGYKRPDMDEDDDDDLTAFSKLGGKRGRCHDKEENDKNCEKIEDDEEDDDLSGYKAIAKADCGSKGSCKREGSTKRRQNSSESLDDEKTDSTHRDWNDDDDDDDDDDDWELTSNIKPSGIELAPNLRSVTDNWNIQTHNWVKYVCYDRCPTCLNLTLSYVLIALWHGFYPGYWISFVQAAILTKTSRLVRRVVRPLFLSPGESNNTPNPELTIKKRYYDFVTWFTTSIFIAYNMAPFFLLEFEASVAFYSSVGWIGHIIVGSAFVVLSFVDWQMASPAVLREVEQLANTHRDLLAEPEGGLEGFEGTWSMSEFPGRRGVHLWNANCANCSPKTSEELKKD